MPDEKSEDLRRRAEALRQTLQAQPRERPFFVEFAGTPKSGKSTCIDSVAHFLRRMEFKVLAPTEGASKRTPYYLKDDLLAFNTWSACYALTHVLEGLHHSDKYDIAILDRGLFDSLVWFDLLASRGEVDEQSRDAIQQFLLLDKWRSVIDLVLLFSAEPEDSMARENKNKLIEKHGRQMNPDALRELNDAYVRVSGRYSDLFTQFHRIDSSDPEMTELVAGQQAVDLMLALLEVETNDD